MPTSKHTQGPWYVVPAAPPYGTFVEASGGHLVCDLYEHAHGKTVPHKNAEANARLIAAAPEMYTTLEALEFLLISDQPEVAAKIGQLLSKIETGEAS